MISKDRQIFQKLFSNLSIAFRDAAQELVLEEKHSSSADPLNSSKVVETSKMDDFPPSSTSEKHADLANDVANVTYSVHEEYDDDHHKHDPRGADVRSNEGVTSSQNDKEEHAVVAPVQDSIDDSPNYHEMNRSQLQEICLARNLRANRKTWELIERIIASETMEPRPPPPRMLYRDEDCDFQFQSQSILF